MKPFLIILLMAAAFIAKAQSSDTTIYSVCISKKFHGPYVGNKQTLMQPADECPKFPGGGKKLNKLLTKHINRIKGLNAKRILVFISFIIEKDGKPSNTKVIHCDDVGAHTTGFSSSALNIIKKLPNWIPGKVKGKNARIQYVLPVYFYLDK